MLPPHMLPHPPPACLPAAAPAATRTPEPRLGTSHVQRGTRKGKKIEPKVKVNAPVAEAINSNREATPAERAETAAVLGLGWFFLLVLVEGLMLAGSVGARIPLAD